MNNSKIHEEISNLSNDELFKLIAYSKKRTSIMKKIGIDIDPEELLNESIVRTLSMRRKRNFEKVDIFGHLLGCIKSISNNLIKKKISHIEIEHDNIDQYPSSDTSTHQFNLIMLKELDDYVKNIIKDDKSLVELVELIKSGYSNKDIREALNLTNSEFDYLLKKLRRKVNKKLILEKYYE